MGELKTLRTLLADANLIAYYKLEDVNDSKASYTLTNNNSVTFPAGKFSNGASLGTSNTNKYLSVNNDMGITSGAVSISLWVKILTAPGTNVLYALFERGDAGVDVRHWIKYIDSGGTKKVQFNRQRENTANDFVDYNVDLGTSEWKHLVLTYNGTTIRGYLNGVDVGNAASSGNGASGVDIDYTYIGAQRTQTPSVAQYASAIIDDVSIWNRALTAAEVALIFKENRSNFFQIFK